jgi:hypothetical protein
MTHRAVEDVYVHSAAGRLKACVVSWGEGRRPVRARCVSLGRARHDDADTPALSEISAGQNASFSVRLVGDVERHHDVVRFRWEATGGGRNRRFGGDDIGLVSDDERFQRVIGFPDSH